LRSPVAEVRKTAALIVEAGGIPGLGPDLAANLQDPDPRARIAMLRGLAKCAWTEEMAATLLAVFPTLQDDWTRSAAAASASDPALVLAAALKVEPAPALLPLLSALAKRAAGLQDAASFVPLLSAAAAAPARADAVKAVILEAAAVLKTAPPASAALEATLKALLASDNVRLSAGTLPIAARWGTSPSVKADVATRIRQALGQIEDPKLADDQRMAQVAALAGARSADAAILPALGKLLSGGGSPALKRHTLAALGMTADPKVGDLILETVSSLDPSAQDAAFALLLSRRDWILALLEAVTSKKVTLPQLGPNNVFRLRSHPDKELAQRSAKVLDAIAKPSTNKDALIASLLPQILKPGRPASGREVFLKNCAACHKFNDVGNQIGPVLTGMGAHGPEFLLTNIVDPNRTVDAGYEAWNVATKNGSIVSGLLGQENDAIMVLKTATGPIEIPKSEIVAAKKSSLSLMPEGLEALGADALRDVIAFLCEGAGNYRVLDLSGAFTTDTRRGLFHSAEALGDTLHFGKFGLVQVDGVPFNLIDPSKSALGGNLIVLRGGGDADYAFAYPRQVEVKVGAPVKSLQLLGGLAGWGASMPKDGPTILTLTLFFAGGAKEVVELKDGVHFLDYPSNGEVPGSKRAEGLMSQGQIRVISVPVANSSVLERMVLSSPGHGTAAVTAAITAELAH
ncbi:MAG TPA: c-type cytochrome, partial [Planctomycetota bacterium]|nr:c-type cytochrome [Planctomycetota bacterium]